MCGICGFNWADGHLLERMKSTLTHRGPDDEGAYISDLHLEPPYPAVPGVALGAPDTTAPRPSWLTDLTDLGSDT